MCDLEEVCDGINDNCPADLPNLTTECNASNGVCDPAEFCSDASDDCPPDVFEDPGTNPSDICDDGNSCTGAFGGPGGACSGTGPDCEPEEPLPDSGGEACGDSSDTACTEPDTCGSSIRSCSVSGDVCSADAECGPDETCDFGPDAGVCLANNEACAFVTNSALCAFDVQPDKGMCTVSNAECVLDADFAQCEAEGGTTCADGYCLNADGDTIGYGLGCKFDDGCGDVDDYCEQTGQFRLVFSPDVKNYPAHKLVASNPGQTFYNLIVDGDPSETVPVIIEIPYPYVTVGGQPVHVYDGTNVRGACVDNGGSPTGASCSTEDQCNEGETCDSSCFAPGEAEQPFDAQWTIEDWTLGDGNSGSFTDSGTGWEVVCDLVAGPNGDDTWPLDAGICTLTLNVDIPDSGQAYVNVHLDYGLKGGGVDANPYDGVADRYDQGDPGNQLFAEPGFDALVDGQDWVGIANCTDYRFSHFDNMTSYGQGVQNLNSFKGIAGAFGHCKKNPATGESCDEGLVVELWKGMPDAGVLVQTGATDEDGAWATVYKHKGKATDYTVRINTGDDPSEAPCYGAIDVTTPLQGNGWVNVDFDTSTCSSTVEYGSGRFAKKKK